MDGGSGSSIGSPLYSVNMLYLTEPPINHRLSPYQPFLACFPLFPPFPITSNPVISFVYDFRYLEVLQINITTRHNREVPGVQARYPEDMPELMTVSEVAAWLKVHPNTIRRWAERGLINSYRIGPRCDRRFDRTEVEQLLLSGSKDGD